MWFHISWLIIIDVMQHGILLEKKEEEMQKLFFCGDFCSLIRSNVTFFVWF